MTRVSENSNVHAINYSVGKTKSRVEDLQLKGSNLKRIGKPSDDPMGNVDLLAARSQNIDAGQYLRNINFAQTQLNFSETMIEELTNILVKAKELAIGQSSDIYNPEVRKSVAQEIKQLNIQALSLANKRIGNRYIFAGQKVLTKPFDENGSYAGDKSKIFIEINKDVFVPINTTGNELFFTDGVAANTASAPNLNQALQDIPKQNLNEADANSDEVIKRDPASVNENINSVEQKQSPVQPETIFHQLKSLENALMTNSPDVIQSLLERLDESIEKTVTIRAKLGSLTNTISNAETNIEKLKLLNEDYKSKLEDADVTELFSNLQKEQNVLKATYQSSANLMNQQLMDFLR
jgi:flagellar hook-associated protein 3 FlgL